MNLAFKLKAHDNKDPTKPLTCLTAKKVKQSSHLEIKKNVGLVQKLCFALHISKPANF